MNYLFYVISNSLFRFTMFDIYGGIRTSRIFSMKNFRLILIK